MIILWGWGRFGTVIGDVNIAGAWGRDWGGLYCEEVGVWGYRLGKLIV